MENKQPLLSICIPTYNRANYLREALDNITTDESFDERVEIVISDNASTDNTQDVVNNYIKRFPNVVYYRNTRNVKDENFFLALSRGKGKYVRLFNDTLRFKKRALEKLINLIKNYSEKTPLYIFQNVDFIENRSQMIKSIDDLLEATSFMTTWIGNMGNWKVFIDNIKDPNNYSNLKLSQVDWHFQIIDKTSVAYIEFGDFFVTSEVSNKGGYNLYEVFVTNYLIILNKYDFLKSSINNEKKLLLKYFIIPWTIQIYINNKLTFSSKKKWLILFKEYWNKPYFYFEIFRMEFKRYIKIIKNLILFYQ